MMDDVPEPSADARMGALDEIFSAVTLPTSWRINDQLSRREKIGRGQKLLVHKYKLFLTENNNHFFFSRQGGGGGTILTF
jgi:hypothetical protein